MNDALKNLWKSEEQTAFSGWDFSCLKDRRQSETLPWDYKEIILGYLKREHMLLDMGTGGGEFLLDLNHPGDHTCVTEAWEPNGRLCRKRLTPLGIGVYRVYGDTRLPFDDNAFDIIINRHASYDLTEVSRILKPGGIFITQQVGCDNNRELIRRLYPEPEPPPAVPHFRLTSEIPKFTLNALQILYCNEAMPEVRSSMSAPLFIMLEPFPGSARIFRWITTSGSCAHCRTTAKNTDIS